MKGRNGRGHSWLGELAAGRLKTFPGQVVLRAGGSGPWEAFFANKDEDTNNPSRESRKEVQQVF